MRQIYAAIGSKVKWPHIIALYIFQILIFQIMTRYIFPIIEYDLGDYHLLDMVKQGYDANYVTKILSLMNERSKDMYLHVQMPLDFLYPLIMATVYFLVFAKVWKKYWHVFCVLPVLLVLFDWAENISIILMFTHSNLIDNVVSFSSFFTQTKSIIGDYVLYYLALLTIGAAIVTHIKKKLAQRSE